jgi:hypothetical protein
MRRRGNIIVSNIERYAQATAFTAWSHFSRYTTAAAGVLKSDNGRIRCRRRRSRHRQLRVFGSVVKVVDLPSQLPAKKRQIAPAAATIKDADMKRIIHSCFCREQLFARCQGHNCLQQQQQQLQIQFSEPLTVGRIGGWAAAGRQAGRPAAFLPHASTFVSLSLLYLCCFSAAAAGMENIESAAATAD